MQIITSTKKYNINFVFQPICSRTNEIVFVECLTRINDINSTTQDFFTSIDDQAKLHIMLAQLELLRNNKCFFEKNNLMATVNVSFKNMDILYEDQIKKIIDDIFFVNLELNELSSHLLSSDALKKFSSYYKYLWLDDFGAGLSNFNIIHEKKFKYIKLDRFMFWKSFNSEEGKNMLHQLIEYLTSEGYFVVIEGIENKIHFEWFKNTSSYAGQGFFWPEMNIDTLKKVYNNKLQFSFQ